MANGTQMPEKDKKMLKQINNLKKGIRDAKEKIEENSMNITKYAAARTVLQDEIKALNVKSQVFDNVDVETPKKQLDELNNKLFKASQENDKHNTSILSNENKINSLKQNINRKYYIQLKKYALDLLEQQIAGGEIPAGEYSKIFENLKQTGTAKHSFGSYPKICNQF